MSFKFLFILCFSICKRNLEVSDSNYGFSWRCVVNLFNQRTPINTTRGQDKTAWKTYNQKIVLTSHLSLFEQCLFRSAYWGVNSMLLGYTKLALLYRMLTSRKEKEEKKSFYQWTVFMTYIDTFKLYRHFQYAYVVRLKRQYIQERRRRSCY